MGATLATVCYYNSAMVKFRRAPAGGKLVGFYGMLGQDYNVAVIVEAAGTAEYMGAVAPAITSRTFSAFKSIPLFTAADVVKASKIAKKVSASYSPPVKSK